MKFCLRQSLATVKFQTAFLSYKIKQSPDTTKHNQIHPRIRRYESELALLDARSVWQMHSQRPQTTGEQKEMKPREASLEKEAIKRVINSVKVSKDHTLLLINQVELTEKIM